MQKELEENKIGYSPTTVKKTQIFPHYWVDPYSFCTGMESAREISGLAKNKPFKVLNVSKL